MDEKYNEIRQHLIDVLNQLNILATDFENLGEKLDSLDRLTVITRCEKSLKVDLTGILIDPDSWLTFKALCQSISRADVTQ